MLAALCVSPPCPLDVLEKGDFVHRHSCRPLQVIHYDDVVVISEEMGEALVWRSGSVAIRGRPGAELLC